ncbi:MAG: response regulator transcription factor [Chloroflexi bacterium]|nr:response regulator transcription factor [Chloroflexota bacterium]MDA1219034.1 response regulator transcription factor [Chloroflexota bacterium]
MTDTSVLVIEDEENLVAVLRYNLEREGYQVHTSYDGIQGLETARKSKPDLVILDVMLPGLDGLEICRILRRESDVPILMLTAKGEEIDRVVGLELGADDYMTKPFSVRELIVRVRGMLRRSRASIDADTHDSMDAKQRPIRVGDLAIDLVRHEATLKGEPLSLKPKEFDLLALLASHRGRAFTREQILERVWGHDFFGEIRTVDVHIRWIREKIQFYPNCPQQIITIRGVGYRFEG